MPAAFTRRMISPRTARSTPGPARSTASPTAISIAAPPDATGPPRSPEQNPAPERRNRRPRQIKTLDAKRIAGCGAARGAVRSCSSPPPAQSSPRQSRFSPPRSSAAAAACPSVSPRDGNGAHQLANYLANQPPSLARVRKDHPIASSPYKRGASFAYNERGEAKNETISRASVVLPRPASCESDAGRNPGATVAQSAVPLPACAHR